MRTPMIAKMVHTAKHTVKASVDIPSARRWSSGEAAAAGVIMKTSVIGNGA
jgi:hypothetical protein